MDSGKFNAVIDYFKSIGISLPTDVRNSIEDVFRENDNIESVECYHLEDADSFQKDLTLTNRVIMSMDGFNSGSTNNVWTYYGALRYSLSESIVLVDTDGSEMEKISDLESYDDTLLETTGDYAVVLLEKVNWDSKEGIFERHPSLYIFCPISENEDPVDKIYNELTGR